MADDLHLLPIKELKMPSAMCKGRIGRVLALGILLVVARISVGAGNDGGEARMRHDIDFLASDQCEGRGVNTAGINLAAQYIANEFQKAGLKPETLPPFSLIDEEAKKTEDKEPKKDEAPDLPAIKDAVAFLNPGEVSDFVASGNEGFIAVLEKREPLAGGPATEKMAAFKKRILDNKERIVFYEWLRDRQQAAGLEFRKG